MRAYSESEEEARRAQDLLKDWVGEGYLTAAQFEEMKGESVCTLRRTNFFLRLAAFFFTLLIVAAAVGLFFALFFSGTPATSFGIFLLICAAACYVAAEVAVSRASLYRFGIEEALAVCSVGLLCIGLILIFDGSPRSPLLIEMAFLVPFAGITLSLWIWHRFGLPYAFLAAIILAVTLPGYWTTSRTEQHLAVAAIFAVGQFVVTAMAPRNRHTYLQQRFSIAEALLWLGIYLAFNLEISGLSRFWMGWSGHWTARDFPRLFYWFTWVMIWCVPPAVLARGLIRRDKFVFAAGMFVSILTLVSNKSYLGGQRNTWDPMLLGALLIGIALAVRHWLATGPGGVRRGFTAQRLSGGDKSLLDAGVVVSGFVSPHVHAPGPSAPTPEARFGGGDSGGGGASSDF